MRAMNIVLIVLGILILIPIAQAVYAPSGQADITADFGVWDNVLYLNDSNPATCAGVGGDAFHNMTWNIKYQISNGLIWPVTDTNSSRNITITQSHSCIWNNAFHAAVQSSGAQVYYKCYTSAFSVVTLYVTNGTQQLCEVGEVLWNASSPYFTIKDEKTEKIITASGTLQIFGSNVSTSITTPASGLFSLLTDSYNFRMSVPSPAYNTRNWYYDYNSSIASSNYTLYMLNTSHALMTTIKVTSMGDIAYPGVIVEAYRQMVTSGQYELVEMARTDINGFAIMSLEPYSIPYKFKVRNDFEYIYNLSGDNYITSANTYIKINTLNDTTTDYYDATGVSYALYYNNATKSFYFQYNNTNNKNITAGRMAVTLHSSLTDTLLCNNTINLSNAQIICNMSLHLNKTGTFTAQGFIQTQQTANKSWYYIDSADKVLNVRLERGWGLSGPLYAFIIILVCFGAGLWNPVAAVMLGCVGLILTVSLGLLPLSATWLVGIIILAFIGVRRLAA